MKRRNIFGRIPGWIPFLSIGILFWVLGIFQGQFADIFRKAVLICLECIGIG